MAREFENFRDNLDRISKRYDHEMLSQKEVCSYLGVSTRVCNQIVKRGWIGNTSSKRISAVQLARELSRI